MSPLPAILICDRDALFREALRNYLFASGYTQVEVAGTAREALARLRHGRYGCILVGVSRPFSLIRRLATIAQRREPEARVLFLVNAENQPFVTAAPFECVIKEYVFSSLLDLISPQGVDNTYRCAGHPGRGKRGGHEPLR